MEDQGDVMPLRRSALHAPNMVVEGQGAFSDGLLERIRADLHAGWHGVYVVPEGCAEDDCLRWWAVSVDGLQRIEQLPAMQVSVVVPESGEQDVDPGIVLAHARQVGERHFPGATEIDVRYYSYEERTSNKDVTLTLHSPGDGKPVHAEVQAWMSVAPREAHATGEDRRTATVRTYVRSLPLDTLDEARLHEWATDRRVWLRVEGWDAQLDECIGWAMMINLMQYIGADEDAREAEAACRREWEIRKAWRAQSMTEIGAPMWHDELPVIAADADQAKIARARAAED